MRLGTFLIAENDGDLHFPHIATIYSTIKVFGKRDNFNAGQWPKRPKTNKT